MTIFGRFWGNLGFFPITALIVSAMLLLGGCAETQLGAHMAKSAMGDRHPDGSGGVYKVGTPYQVFGVWYYPQENDKYDSTGIASWYGAQFHGKKTANGEIFDMNAVSAAHPTLPMPTLARVTNLENGRSIVVRVNDRGPFAKGREIDMSKRAAELLGFLNQGTAKVRVQYLGPAPMPGGPPVNVASYQETFVMPAAESKPEDLDAVPVAGVKTASLSGEPLPLVPATQAEATPQGASMQPIPDDKAPPQVQVEKVPVSGANNLYVQAGAFSNYENALTVKQQLSQLGEASISETTVGEQTLYRVRVPAENVDSADQLLNGVVQRGHAGARIIVD
ncbi:septal ring lytic transglycosylase RlpA family protein [Tepidicaulis sp. LMO-SS28]|uniref:septal ring lytic transglycosylase RlpA family protein n=1 Tax=Tepidicaulis sp. LMO-SS28 TaxID=3447455 RepID=UPI003EE3434A